MAARWKIEPVPGAMMSRMTPGAAMSPVTMWRRLSSGRASCGGALSKSTSSSIRASLPSAPASAPRSRRRMAMRRPMKPVPPVMTTFMTALSSPADAVALRPAEAGDGPRLRPILAADPALVAELVQEVVKEGIVDLADIGLVAPRRAGDLHMTDARDQSPRALGKVALHDLA